MKAEKKAKVAQEKRNLVFNLLSNGQTKAAAMRAVKAKFGSGIASRDVGEAANAVKEHKAGRRPPGLPIEVREEDQPLVKGARIAGQYLKEAYRAAEPVCQVRRFIIKQNGVKLAVGVQIDDKDLFIDGGVTLEWVEG